MSDKRAIPTLGNTIIKWIQDNVVIPDGEYEGKPFILSEDQKYFIRGMYAIKPDAKVDLIKPGRAFYYPRGGQLVAPQKWGKGPLAAAIILAEAYGPVLFDGWLDGKPQGRPWSTPWIQVTAISEDQTDNVWRVLLPMITLGNLSAEIPDTGLSRINLPNRGIIEPVTSSARSRLGQRITFSVQDEAHDWLRTNGGRKLADTQRRNLAGMGGRFLETGNAWDPAEDSVAQTTFEKESGVFSFMLHPGPGSVRNMKERMKVLNGLYGGSWWVDTERISEEIDVLLKRGDYAQAERFFMNRIVPAEDRAFDRRKWDELADPDHEVPDKAQIAVGVDGARYRDSLALVATEIKTGYQWLLGVWERPENAPEDYEHDFDEVDGVMSDAWTRWNVWRIYIDPGSQVANIDPLMRRWQQRWGDKRVVEWLMNRPKPTAYAVRNFTAAIISGDLSHDGNETFARHIANARRKNANVRDEDGREMFHIQKEAPNSPNKIDAAAAAVLSWEAKSDALSKGKGSTSVYARRTCDCDKYRTRHAPGPGCPGYVDEETSGRAVVSQAS